MRKTLQEAGIELAGKPSELKCLDDKVAVTVEGTVPCGRRTLPALGCTVLRARNSAGACW